MYLLGTFFDLTSGDIATTTAYAKGLISDFFPILAIVIGIAIAGMIINMILKR